jgi:predicted permease
MVSDLRYAFRQLTKSPGFAAIAILTLALGIGACTAIFSLVDTVLLRPLPYPQADRIMVVRQKFKGQQDIPFSWPNFQDARRDNRSFEALAVTQRGQYTISGRGVAEKVSGSLVSSDFFRVLDVPMIVGRPFTAKEDQVGGDKVVVIRASLWQRKLGGKTDAVGQSLTIDGVSYTVVGVLPDDVITPSLSEFWLPITPFSTDASWQKRGNQPGLFAYGRLAKNITVKQAQADLRAIGQRLEAQYPYENAETSLSVTPLLDALVSNYRQALWMLLGAVGLLLAIACANVGSLQLSRTLARTQEFSIRAALGSSRAQLCRQLLVENSVVFLLGGGLGILLALWSLDWVKAFSPSSVRFQNLSINGTVLLFSLGATLVTALFFGLWPALRAAQVDLREALQAAGRGTIGGSSQWTRQIMVAGQVALTVMLVAGAGLFVRSLAEIRRFSFGFDPHNLLVFSVSVPEQGATYQKPEQRVALFNSIRRELEAIPGVSAVGMNFSLPLHTQWSTYFDVAGREPYPAGHEPGMEMGVIDENYFGAIGLPVLRGRNFNSSDRSDSREKIIIDERMAQTIWPGQDPIGKVLFRGRAANRSSDEKRGTEVIGLVPTVALYGINGGPENYFQGYLAQSQAAFNEMNFVLRTSLPPLSLERAVRQAIAAVDSGIPLYGLKTMEQMIAADHATQSLQSRLVGFFAAVALLLAALGLHGVVAHAMATRRRELGVRLALGALQRQLVFLVFRQGALPLLIGAAIGVMATAAVGRLIASLLYHVSPYDFTTLSLSVGVLLATGLFALWLPARRATRIDPMIALRAE